MGDELNKRPIYDFIKLFARFAIIFLLVIICSFGNYVFIGGTV